MRWKVRAAWAICISTMFAMFIVDLMTNKSPMFVHDADGFGRAPASAFSLVSHIEAPVDLVSSAITELAAGAVPAPIMPDRWTMAQRLLDQKLRDPKLPRAFQELKDNYSQVLKARGLRYDSLEDANLEMLTKDCTAGWVAACLKEVWRRNSFLEARVEEIRRSLPDQDNGTDERYVNLKKLHQEIRDTALFACVEGASEACSIASQFLSQDSLVKLESLSRSYCAGGSEEYCAEHEASLRHWLFLGPSKENLACWNLGAELPCFLRSEAELAALRVEYVALAQRRCVDGNLASCSNLVGDDFLASDDPRLDLAMAALHRSCVDGDHAVGNQSGACEEMASLFRKRGDASYAATYSELACSKGRAGGCLQLAKLAFERSGELLEASSFLRRYCDVIGPLPDDGQPGSSSEMCRALSATNQPGRDFWSRHGHTLVVVGNVKIVQFDQYLFDKSDF